MKKYKTDDDCEKLFNRFMELKNTANQLPHNIQDVAAIVQNTNIIVTEEDLKSFFDQVTKIQDKLEAMVFELGNLYCDVDAYIDERET